MIGILNLSNLCVDDDRVKGPILVFVRSCDLLLHGSDEALRIEESCDPKGIGTPCLEPTLILLVSHQQTPIPDTKIRSEPRELIPSRTME